METHSNVGTIESIKFIEIIDYKELKFKKYLISFQEYDGYFTILRYASHNEINIGSILTFNIDRNTIRPYNVIKL